MAAAAPDPDDVSATHRTPRWVKVLGILTAAVIALIVAIMLLGGGEHGPGRHLQPRGLSGGIPPSAATAGHALLADDPR